LWLLQENKTMVSEIRRQHIYPPIPQITFHIWVELTDSSVGRVPLNNAWGIQNADFKTCKYCSM
jgi:hypothetical protein